MACACHSKPKPADKAVRAAILAAIAKMQTVRPSLGDANEDNAAAALTGHTVAEAMAVLGMTADVLKSGYAALGNAPTLAKVYSATSKANIVGALKSRLDGVNAYAMRVYSALQALPYDKILTATQVAQVAHTVSASQIALNDVSSEWSNQTWDLSNFASEVTSRAAGVVRSVAENALSAVGLPRWLLPVGAAGALGILGFGLYRRVRA